MYITHAFLPNPTRMTKNDVLFYDSYGTKELPLVTYVYTHMHTHARNT